MCALYLLVAFAPLYNHLFNRHLFNRRLQLPNGGNVWSKQLGPPRLIRPCQGVRDQNIPCICGSFHSNMANLHRDCSSVQLYSYYHGDMPVF